MKNSLYIFFIFIQTFKYLYGQIITFPFKRILPSSIDESNFFSNYANNIIYTSLKIGTPPTEIKAQIKTTQYSLCVRNDSIFDYDSSSTYKQNGEEFTSYNLDYFKAIPSNESLIIGKENKQINHIKFMLTKKSKYDLDGILGLLIHENNYKTYDHGLTSQLKPRKLINQEVFFFNYNKEKEEGELVIGDYPHSLEEFKNKFFEEQKEATNIHVPSLDILYDISLRSLFWEEKIIETMYTGRIDIESGFIIGTKLFEDACKESFFKPHLDNKKCEKKEEKLSYAVYNFYICEDYSELDITKFPEIKFYNSDTNYNLSLTYEDLFIKKNGKIYFMIIFNKEGYNGQWTLGNIFLKRNMIVFDMDKRILAFYDTNKSKNENISYITYIIIISIAGVVIIGLIGFIIFKFVFKARNKKAYELKEDFEYSNRIND